MKKILLNILTHGDELVGIDIANRIKALYPDLIGNGIDIQIANKRAYKGAKRYIDCDLNRIFPGNPSGSYEERRAHELVPIISSYELTIDVHSTESGSGDMVIVTKMDSATKAVLKGLSPKYVLFMNMIPDRSLISQARIGIAFEMGRDKDESTAVKTVKCIEYLLSYMGISAPRESLCFQTEFFDVFAQIPKPAGVSLEKHVENFKLIRKGEAFAKKKDGTMLIAEFDFYPVIFGNTNYETIFGFAARKLSFNDIKSR
jgi:succinylglutamate desuccinylase